MFVSNEESAPAPEIVVTKERFGLMSAVVQLIGFLILFWIPFGTIVGIVILVRGHLMYLYGVHRCSECAEKVRPEARVCPHCAARFDH